jgi:TRAP-type C4-dicarboxylate transport system permease small subunit
MLAGLLKLKKGMISVLNTVLIVAVFLLVIDVVLGVVTRYALGAQVKWTEELARFLLIWVSLLGGAVAFGTKAHLGVDFFVGKLHPEAQKMMAVVVHLIVLFFAVSIFIWGGSQVVTDSFLMGQKTPALEWKMGYVYLALPLAGIFMALFTLENLVETLVVQPTLEEVE